MLQPDSVEMALSIHEGDVDMLVAVEIRGWGLKGG